MSNGAESAESNESAERKDTGLNKFGRPVGSDYDPHGEELTPQEAVDRIFALMRRGQAECYLPENPKMNKKNGGRVRALSQALTLLERAGLEPDSGAARLNDNEEMEVFR